MIYTDLTKKALKLSFQKHKDQVEKSGLPYIHHPIIVAEHMNDEETTIVALLHDVVEDTNTTFEEIESYGFSKDVMDALKLMTHKEGVDYFDYVHEIGKNRIAREVKLKDLEHNMQISRLDTVTKKDLDRVKKYKKAHDYLLSVI